MKTLIKLLAAASVTSMCVTSTKAADGIKVEHLGVNNTLVRVDPDMGKYLLMPVQDAGDEATVNVLVDGKLDRTVYVRLAKGKIDYNVPLDIDRYKGHNVVLNVVTQQNRSNVREAANDACWTNFAITDNFDTTDREHQYRPAYHHTPLYGWMNDPNGMFYKDGKWHLYYQWNPFGSKWQNMTWGHSATEDFLNWEHYPTAIEPDGLGAIFSGSSVVDKENTAGFGKDAVVALFTSAGTSQMQSLAHSNDDGVTFEVYPGNPIITRETEFRDPNMFWHEPTGQWVLTLAHALEHEMLIYTSPNLRDWTYASSFGKDLGSQDGVWECPDLMEVEVEGTGEKKWVLICNINPGGPFGGSATQYFVGDFDGKTFTPDRDASGNVPTKWMDFGKDHYATVSFSGAPDDRNTVIGWMSNWQYAAEVPTMQFRSANTVPRDITLFRGDDGQLYTVSAPSPEMDALHSSKLNLPSGFSVGDKGRTLTLATGADAGICDLTLDVDARGCRSVTFTLSNAKGEKCDMVYNPQEGTINFDRRNSGLTDFSVDFPAVTVSPTFDREKGKLNLRLMLDRSSVELFANGGRGVMTNLVFPTVPYTRLTIAADGGKAKISGLAGYTMRHADAR